ncbi:hypothetical protein BS78_08G038200 [Paspalum vaginatum]|nr:hypothetical protein BS78_08G038200 [Paspalum vaginatum]
MSSSSPADGKGCDAPAPKTEWPELKGSTIKEATEKINAERPDLRVEPVTVGTAVTQEFDPTRVRLWVDIVSEIPKIG